ncbi:hypothetical protein TNCT_500681 [Trichonephila clavata]|uniref:Uncharacterized protein n=1 Tax=Trichonephila clavata TaxID=2740835 RepID=A0A8X6H0F1_TRICU|nr:hypothetical protein TNCT_500681 [Trichonephila clavata]
MDEVNQKLLQSHKMTYTPVTIDRYFTINTRKNIPLHLDLIMHPYRVYAVQALKPANTKDYLQFLDSLFIEMTMNSLDMDLFFIFDAAWFHFSSYVSL